MKEQLIKLHEAACYIFTALYNINEPDTVSFDSTGTISVSNTEYYCGDPDTTTLYLELEELLKPEETITKIKQKWKQEEEEKKIAAEKQKKIDEQRTLELEKKQYEKLKKKFESD